MIIGVPFAESGPEQSDETRDGLSVILHELTHLTCFRTTRLGWIAHALAARLLKSWTHNEVPVLSGRTAQLVAAMTPMLEGLAIYAQLDLDNDNSRLALYSPPVFYAHATSIFGSTPTPQVLCAARQSQIWSGKGSNRGLLRLLFLDADSSVATQNVYLIGYLWVKAVAALLSSRCPALRPAEVMLPLLIRMVCDHPALLRAHRGELAINKLVPTIHRSVVEWGADNLGRLAAMLEVESKRDRIDYLHVADFLEGDDSALNYMPEADAEVVSTIGIFDAESLGQFLKVRVASEFHFTSRCRGIVRNVDAAQHRIVLDAEGVEVTIDIAPILDIWELLRSRGGDINRLHRTFGPALHLQQTFLRLAKEVKGVVTIAKFFGLGSPHGSGMVIWDDVGNRWADIQFLPECVDDERYRHRLEVAMSMSLEQRLAFARAVVDGKDVAGHASSAVADLLDTLVSSAGVKRTVTDSGFASALPPRARSELVEWADLRVPRLLHAPTESLLGDIASIVDFAGFPVGTDGAQVVCGDLFPVIR